MSSNDIQYVLDEIFDQSAIARSDVVVSNYFRRTRCASFDRGSVLLDTFPDAGGASCCFVRLARDKERTVRLVARGVNRCEPCSSGGWLLSSTESTSTSYWLPQPPSLRTVDADVALPTLKTLSTRTSRSLLRHRAICRPPEPCHRFLLHLQRLRGGLPPVDFAGWRPPWSFRSAPRRGFLRGAPPTPRNSH